MINEVVVVGVPPSRQAHRRSRVQTWIEHVAATAREAIRPEDRHEFVKVSVCIIHFCVNGTGDLDNIAKPILDGLRGPAYPDDGDITQLIVRRTDLSKGPFTFVDAPAQLLEAAERASSSSQELIYIRIADEVDHRRMPWNP